MKQMKFCFLQHKVSWLESSVSTKVWVWIKRNLPKLGMLYYLLSLDPLVPNMGRVHISIDSPNHTFSSEL